MPWMQLKQRGLVRTSPCAIEGPKFISVSQEWGLLVFLGFQAKGIQKANCLLSDAQEVRTNLCIVGEVGRGTLSEGQFICFFTPTTGSLEDLLCAVLGTQA